MPRTSPRYFHSGILPLGAVVALVWVAGCSPPSTEQLRQEVLKADPDFSETLGKHREIVNRINTLSRELALKRATIEQAIAKQRKDLSDAAEGVRSKTAEIKRRMEPDRQRLTLTLAMAGEELRAKQAQRASLGRSMARLRKATKDNTALWSPQERARHDTQLQELLQDATRLDQELVAIQAHIRLLKIKLILIKL